jgi:hypothetical protein
MVILLGSVIIFNFLAFKLVNRFSGNMILHIWIFTCFFQLLFDTFIDLKYHGYWYISKGIDWSALPGYTLLIPPINLLFLNWFPFNTSLIKRIAYIVVWEVALLCYEYIALLPEPWGFFHYGWWSLWHSAFINPILLIIILGYYKLVSTLEAKVNNKSIKGQII